MGPPGLFPMLRYVLIKFATLVLLLILVSLTVFAVLFVLPGDPAQIILGIHATPESLARRRADWVGNLLLGRSALSIHYKMPVFELVASRLAVTGPLALLAMLFAVAFAVPLGIYAARHQNRPQDLAVMAFTQVGLATPEFWLGILLVLLFSVELNWFAAGGFPGWAADPLGSLKALLLPAFALGIIRAAILARLTRSSMLDVLREDYIRTARAKGLRERTVIYVHALRNALIPVLTILGLQLGQLLAGAIIIENVFFLPGLGRLVFTAIGMRDLPVVRDVVLLMAAAVVFVNFLVDLAYAAVDPRIELH